MLNSKIINLFFGSLLFYSSFLFSQTETTRIKYSNKINSETTKEYLSILASDSLEGRETGERGQKMAAQYIAKKFREFGVKPTIKDTGYFQQYPMMIQSSRHVKVAQSTGKYTTASDSPRTMIYDNYKDTDYFAFYGLTEQIIQTNIVFAGYGINDNAYNDYNGVFALGKIVMVLDGEPLSKDSISPITKLKGKTQWSGYSAYKKKEEIARARDASALIIVIDDFKTQYEKSKYKINHVSIRLINDSSSTNSLEKKIPVVFVSRSMANWILKKEKTSIDKLKANWGKNSSKKIFISKQQLNMEVNVREKKMYAENVVGLVEGSEFPKEYIVISAHYDHLGVSEGKVYNGADDDGSGTVAMMNLAKAFAEAKKEGYGPKRSILFIAFSGEEKGLLGSEYYTSHPLFPMANTVADLNIDMIGRIDPQHKDSADYVYIIGSNKMSTELHNTNEANNKQYVGLKLDYTYNRTNDPNRFYYRSDHYNFVKNGVPVIFYFNGTHADYHKETDEISKINFDLLTKRAKLVFFTAWELANRKDRIVIDVKQKTDE